MFMDFKKFEKVCKIYKNSKSLNYYENLKDIALKLSENPEEFEKAIKIITKHIKI